MTAQRRAPAQAPTADPASAIGTALAPRLRAVRVPSVLVASGGLVLVLFGLPLAAGAASAGSAFLLLLIFAETFVFTAVGTIVAYALVPREVRWAMEVILWLRWTERARIAASGEPRPDTAAEARAWIAAHGRATPDAATVDALTLLRDYDTARTLARSLPGRDPWETFDRESRLAWLDLLQTGTADLRRVRKAADAVDPERRLEARTTVALAEAHADAWARPRSDAWLIPLVAARKAIGAAANGVLRRTYVRQQLILFGVAGLAVSVIVTVASAILR